MALYEVEVSRLNPSQTLTITSLTQGFQNTANEGGRHIAYVLCSNLEDS